jgi:tryptophanyl-tRNA synthetase
MTTSKTKTPPARIITGIRPSANLTVANLIGSVVPILELQKGTTPISVFVATMHGLTDHEAKEVVPNVIEVARDYLALGLDPDRVTIFDQRTVRKEVALLKVYLERHMTIARLVRVPTLKDKLKAGQNPENASALLALYPIMMAADILLQDATLVPVGKDQLSHVEAARELARAFDAKYGNALVVPDALNQQEPVNILALRGEGKMSKSKPDDAIFLVDTEEVIRKKIKRAETANPGEPSEKIDSLVYLAKSIAPHRASDIDHLIVRHLAGEKVMAEFKGLLADLLVEFTGSFQKRRAKITKKMAEQVLIDGGQVALARAQTVVDRVERAMGITA